jgi:hypothetical protein
VLSERRLAARPVGAQSAIATVFASRILRMEWELRCQEIETRPAELDPGKLGCHVF